MMYTTTKYSLPKQLHLSIHPFVEKKSSGEEILDMLQVLSYPKRKVSSAKAGTKREAL